MSTLRHGPPVSFGTPRPARPASTGGRAAETAAFFDVLHGRASLEDETTLARLSPADAWTLRKLAAELDAYNAQRGQIASPPQPAVPFAGYSYFQRTRCP